ncbi:MAG: hypothetical protein ACT4RN_22595 [Pseudonocardia sp.]
MAATLDAVPTATAARPARTTAARTWRQLLVALHVVSSVSWLSQAAALAVLLGTSAAAPPGELKIATARVAELLDATVLVYSANVSAFTGFALAAMTTWGYFHHWWVAAKFVVTFGQLYLGIFVLSATLHEVADAAAAGRDGPVGGLVAASVLMASALAVQVWVSVAKPWGRTPLDRPRPQPAPAPMLAAAVLVPVADVVLAVTVFGQPLPALSLALLAAALVARRRRSPLPT